MKLNMATITSWQLIAALCCILLEGTSSALSKTFTQADNPIGGPAYPSSYTSSLDYGRKPSYQPTLNHYASATDLAAPLFNSAAASAAAVKTMADFNEEALASATGNYQLQQQPRVYQSTVDRIVAPARQASTVQASTTTVGDLNTAAGHHHGHHHGKYYEYREVPKKKTWKFGYKRGNSKHHIERHEHGMAGKHPHFKTKVKWADKKSKGKGIHLWDYNHHDKKHYHHGR